jgi:hypothetical protein
MAILETIQDTGGRAVALAKWLGRWAYTRKKLEASVSVSACPFHEAVSINCNPGEVTIWLRVCNYSPFELALLDMCLTLNTCGPSQQIFPADKAPVPAFGHKDYYLHHALNPAQVALGQDIKPRFEYSLTLKSWLWPEVKKSGYIDNAPYRVF